MNSFWKYVMGL